MKKSFAFVLSMCACSLSFAQEFAITKPSKFTWSIFVAPTVANRLLSADDVDDTFLDILRGIETPKPGSSVGMLMSYKVHKKISLQSGFSFSNNGYAELKREFTGEIGPLSATAMRTVYRYHFFDIPLQLKYTFLEKGKLSFYALAGMEANFNIRNNKVDTYWYGDEKEKEKNRDFVFPYEFRKYNCSVTGAVGMDIKVNEKIEIFVQPTFRQMVLSAVQDFPIERRLNSTGLNTGVTVNL